MGKLKKIDDYLGSKIGRLVGVTFIALAFGILGWCVARVADRSEWAINNFELNGASLGWYILIVLKVFPVLIAVLGGYLFRRTKPIAIGLLFMFSSVTFMLVG